MFLRSHRLLASSGWCERFPCPGPDVRIGHRYDHTSGQTHLVLPRLGTSSSTAGAPSEELLATVPSAVQEKKKKKKKDKTASTIDVDDVGANVCSRISSAGATKEAFEEAVTSSKCQCLASCKIKLPQDKIQQAIEQIAAHLKVEMVDCVPRAVSFFGRVDKKHPLAVLIKARSSGISVEVRSYNDEFTAAVLVEAQACARTL